MTIQLFANPYNPSATGFQFSSLGEYNALYQQHAPTEEYSIEFLEGDHFAEKLFSAMNCDQGSLSLYFEILEEAGEDETTQAGICCLLENNVVCAEDVVRKVTRECITFEGTLTDYAYDFVNECYFDKNTPELLKTYFDYDMFANDLRIERGLFEYEFEGVEIIVDPS